MSAPAFIAGDWGTTHLRLYLCDEAGKALDTQNGAGVSGLRDDVGGAFFRAVESWDRAHGKLPAVLCGMVGSTIGWREVAYLNCPARPEAIAKSTLCFAAEGRPIAIAPGLTCRNRLLAPDMMRGEETQILGAIRCEPKLAVGRQFLCMPGTHTKWVSLKDGAVEHFLTALTGELFDILHNHSVLVNAAGVPEVVGGPEFSRALEQTKLYPDAELIHLLFEVRSRQLKGELKRSDAAAYLSGLIIGQDVSGAKRFFRRDLEEAGNVVVIGSPKLTGLYAQALRTRDLPVTRIDGEVASLAGLTMLYDALFGEAAVRPERLLDDLPVVAILRGVSPDSVIAVSEVLYDAGIRIIEVPLNSPDPYRSIEQLSRTFGDRCLCGAGTVLSADEVQRAHDAGARLIVSPNTNAAVIGRTLALEMVSMPGFATATEAFTAIGAGATRLKLFPASSYGAGHVKALRAVLPSGTRLYAVGGIGVNHVVEWMSAGVAGFGFGSELFKPDYSLGEISKRASEIVRAVRGAISDR